MHFNCSGKNKPDDGKCKTRRIVITKPITGRYTSTHPRGEKRKENLKYSRGKVLHNSLADSYFLEN